MSDFLFLAAPFAPPVSSLNVISLYYSFLKHNAIDGVFVNGTTGEGMSLMFDERVQTVRVWCAVRSGSPFQVIVNVSHDALGTAQELAKLATKDNADGIAVAAPCTYKISTIRGLVEWCQEIAKEAPTMPFYYYYIPQLSGVVLPMREFVRLAVEKIKTFRGLKFTSDRLDDFGACCELGKKHNLQIFFGRDEMLLSALPYEPAGAVGSTYNFMAPAYQRLLASYAQGNIELAAGWQARARRVIECVQSQDPGFIGHAKQIMRLLGVDCGPVRLPLQPPPPESFEALKSRLRELDFVMFCSQHPAKPLVI